MTTMLHGSAMRYCLVGRYIGVQSVPVEHGGPFAAVLELGQGAVTLPEDLDEALAVLSRHPTAGAFRDWEVLEERPWGREDFLGWLMSQGLVVSFRPGQVLPSAMLDRLRLVRHDDSASADVLHGLLGAVVSAPSIRVGLDAAAEPLQVRPTALLVQLSTELAGALDQQLVRFDYAVA